MAAAFFVIISLSDAAGRFAWPALSDTIGGRGAFLGMFCLQAAAFLLMPTVAVGSLAVFRVLCMVMSGYGSGYGGGYGGGYGTISTLVGAYYGARGLGAVYASVFTASAAASFGAPLLLARSADLLGSYYPALYATAGLMLAGAVVSGLAGPPARRRKG